jgi:hypothetical protein
MTNDELPENLRKINYLPPASPDECVLDIVTPTCNRKAELQEQAARLGVQLLPKDRWIIVDDATSGGAVDPREIVKHLPAADNLLFVALSYSKLGHPYGSTLNRARHAACSLARPGSWVVEIDDHDALAPECLNSIRQAICSGAVFLYGDVVHVSPGGIDLGPYVKPDYVPWLLRDECSPTEGVRAFPKWLYESVGGYRWHGPNDVGGNEWPAGDYGLFMRMEEFCGGMGFYHIPRVLCWTVKHPQGISGQYAHEQAGMAACLRAAAHAGELF